MAELDVVIVTYECRDLVLDCLDSLEPQRGAIDLDVHLVDNASTDGTLAAVALRHPWVRARSAGGNVGFSRGNNLALAGCSSDRVLLLNPDTVVAPGALRACLDELDRQPAVGVLGCKLVRPDGTLDHAAKRGEPSPAASLAYFLRLGRVFPRSRRFAAYTAGDLGADEAGDVASVNGAFMLVRGEALAVVGPLDERFWMYGEDLDWCRRFRDAGWRVHYWPGASVTHVKAGSSTALRSWRTNRAFHQAMWLYHRKHNAPQTPAVVNWAVGTAIASKLGLSALRSAVLRRI